MKGSLNVEFFGGQFGRSGGWDVVKALWGGLLLSAAGSVARRAAAPGGDSTRAASQAFWRGFAGVVPSGCSERMRAHFSEGSETVPGLVRVMPRG